MPAKGQVQVIVIMAQEYSWAVCVCVPVIYLLYNAPQFPHWALIFPRKLRLLLGFLLQLVAAIIAAYLHSFRVQILVASRVN